MEDGEKKMVIMMRRYLDFFEMWMKIKEMTIEESWWSMMRSLFSPDWVRAFHDFSQSLLSEPILCNLSIYSAMVSQLLIHWIRNIKKRSVQKTVNLVDFTILWNKRWSSSLTEICKMLKLFTKTWFKECVFYTPFFHFSLHSCQLNGAHHVTILKTCLNEEPMPMLS